MIALALQALIFLAITRILWRTVRWYVFKSDVDNIPGPKSASFWYGNFHQVFNPDAWKYHEGISKQYGSTIRINSSFGDKNIYLFDPKAMHHVVVKDQHIYEESDAFIFGNQIIFGHGLLATLGDQHKKQRKMLNPVFSINHMREMLPTFYSIVQKLQSTLLVKVKGSEPQEIDVLHWISRTALELIGQSGLGYSFDTLEENATPHPYAASAKELVFLTISFVWLRNFVLPWAIKLGPPSFRRFIVDIIPSPRLHKLRDIINVMHKTSVDIIEEKKAAFARGDEAVAAQIGHGKDIMSILMRANMEATEEDRLDDEELLGQVSSFIFAAMDTTSSALSRTLHLLSQNLDIQNKLREEIRQIRKDGHEPSHDELVSLPYLDAVCRETLRMYPPLSTVQRIARQDAVLPLSTPVHGLDGRDMHSLHIPKDTTIILSVFSANRNPDVWGPDAAEWKPERWLKSLPDSVGNAHIPGVYSHLMTFLGGSRACIGFKFSQLEMKAVLVHLLEKFQFTPSDKEIGWMMGGITQPCVKGNMGTPSLPLNVARV